MNQQTRDIYEFGAFRLDPDERVLRRGGEIILLSPKVIETLLLLVEAAGRVQSRDFLINALWADSFVEEGSLTQNISILRKNLGTDEDGRQYIETLPKRGYRFAGEVRRIPKFKVEPVYQKTNGDEILAAENLETPDFQKPSESRAAEFPEIVETEKVETLQSRQLEQNEPAKSFSQTAPVRKFGGRAAIVVLVGAACLIAAFVSLQWERKVSTVSELRSIAILPFRDIKGESNDEYLGFGLTDSLITKLGNLPSLSVRPTSAVRKYNQKEVDAVAAGRELGVEAVMEGTVQQIGNRLRITVQLVRVSDGASLWSEKFDAEFTTLLAVEDSISEQVAERLARHLGDKEKRQLKKQYTANPEAHRLYLQGRYFWSQRTAKGLRRAVELFGEAIKLDENYALAYAGLADCYVTMGDSLYNYLPPTEAFPKARSAAQKALEIDDALAEAYAPLAGVQMTYDYDLPAARKSFQRAVEINPRYTTALQGYGWYFIAARQFAEAEQMMRRAREQDPISPIIAVEVGYPAFFAGDYERALTLFSAALELDENHPAVHFALWRAYQQKGEYANAFREIELIEKSSGKTSFTALLRGVTLAASGETAKANETLDALIAGKERSEYIQPSLLSVLCAELDRRDEAFKFLNQGLNERNDIVFLRVSPEFKRLHSDPRFSELVRRTGLE